MRKGGKILRKLLIIIIALAGIIAVVTTCASQPAIRKDVIRLHILANSDSELDQSTKLWVRDLVLNRWGSKLSSFGSAQDAWSSLGALLPKIESDLSQTLQANGIGYDVKVESGVFDFPDRDYNGIDFPAGKYEALRIRLGKAAGHNWWCVMFPPLCLVGADDDFDLEKYKQMVKDLKAQDEGRKTTSDTKAPEAPVRSWLVDKSGGADRWDSDFVDWVKQFWLSGEQ
jgi:stage II sporulation protein R